MKLPQITRFAAAIFLGAFLLFQVQPLIARYILPWFGGTPSAWTVCVLFFQCLLVVGYTYAHWLSRISPRKQVIVHIVLLLLTLPFLPIIPWEGWKPDGSGDPTLRILCLLACTIGPPYILLSTTSPLLQSWFSRSYPNASPYRLYSLSNAGALVALVTYPVLIEPMLRLSTQAVVWSMAYGGFALLFGYCALRMWKTADLLAAPPALGESGGHPRPPTADQSAPPQPVWADKPGLPVCLFWMALPACGSTILLAATNQMCCDVSVVPFLWVLPLALYLLSFILCFHHQRWYFKPLFWPLLIAVIACMIALSTTGVNAPVWFQIAGFSAGAFVCFMVCHGETALLKPNPTHLTLFYLMLAIGGAAGGIFVGVLAPRLFTGYYELHIGLWFCCVLPMLALRTVREPYGTLKYRTAARIIVASETLVVVILGYMLFEHARLAPPGRVSASRNFYGTLAVTNHDTAHPARAYGVLRHGRINHGSQFAAAEQRRIPTTYYGEDSGIGAAIRSLPTNTPARVGIVGLGTGTIAAYGRPGDCYRFYEINPAIITLAGRFFTYLGDSQANCRIVEGDARITMEREPARNYDLLAVDAFTGDAIPVHLLTREAVLLYLRHMKEDGILAIHISNRYLDLEPVVRAIADDLRICATNIRHTAAADKNSLVFSSTWILLARDRVTLEADPIRSAAMKHCPAPPRPCPVWTDDYNDLCMRLTTLRRTEKK